MGQFDDLIPGSVAKTGGGTFDDLIPQVASEPSPQKLRADRLRKIVAGSLGADPGASEVFNDAFTLGLRKPVAGLAAGLDGTINSLIGMHPEKPQGFGEGYQAGVGGYQDYMDKAKENSGWGGTAAGVVGGLTSGGPARGVVQSGIAAAMKNAAISGGVEGAARNSEDPESALEGAGWGAGGAAATTGVIGTIAKGIGGLLPSSFRSRRAERLANRGTPPDEIRTAARSLYKQLDDAGVAYDNNQATSFVDDALQDLRQNGWSPQGVHASLNGVIQQIADLRGQPMSLERLQQLREQIGSEAGANEPQVRRIAGRLLNSIDGYVRSVSPAVSTLPADQIAPMWSEARRLWRTAAAADDIGWRLDKATRRSDSTSSGTNIDNPIRQNVRSVVDKATEPRRFNPYSPEELAQMGRVVEGSPVQNLLRSVGNRFGGSGPMATSADISLGVGGGLGAMLHGAEPTTAALAGGALGAGLYGIGKGARMAADRMSENEADGLVRLISTGSLARGAPMAQQLVPTRAMLARLMAQQSMLRGAGVVGGQEASQ